MTERREELRAADVDRQFVADRLKAALDEGRLSLHEYDDRLRDTYGAQTYGDLDRLLADLPAAGQSQLAPRPPAGAAQAQAQSPESAAAPQRRGIPRWIIATWSSWITVSLIVNAIWLAAVLNGGGGTYWPVWVMLPWGAVLLAGTVTGFAGGAGHLERKQARRGDRRERRRERRGY